MTFENEDTQTEFHKLSTERQIEIVEVSERLAKAGLFVHVCLVQRDDERLQVLVRIAD